MPISDSPLSQPFEAEDIASIRQLVSSHPAVSELSRARRQDLILAIDEIVTNAVRHGGGRGHLEVWLGDGRLCFRVTDYGPGMVTEPATVAPAPTQLGGRGMWIARQVVDDMTISTGATGTVITATMII